MTPPEKMVWRLLHRGELAALNWRRQAPLGRYIADFVSHPARLVLEIDGAQHAEHNQAKHDAQRTSWLESQGYCVLRVWNKEATSEQDGVWLAIHAAASQTPAAMRMQRWREKHLADVREQNASLPLDGGGARGAGGGGARATAKDTPPAAQQAASQASPPQSSLRDDSSPIEGERDEVE